MLILTRRVGQTIQIGPDISVTVVQVSGDQVRLGISAPASVEINRQELLEQIARENALAAETAPDGDDVESLLDQQSGAPARREKGS